jgi:hypothetical protein
MLRVVRRTAVTLLLSGLLMAAGLLVATPASACSCVGQTTQEFFDRADAVFTAPAGVAGGAGADDQQR